MRRQLSDSAVISTGRPERVNRKAISGSRLGPPRTVTRSGLRLTKRGTGKPLVAPTPRSPAAEAFGIELVMAPRATSSARAPATEQRRAFARRGEAETFRQAA